MDMIFKAVFILCMSKSFACEQQCSACSAFGEI